MLQYKNAKVSPVGKLCVSAVKMICRTSSILSNLDAVVVSEGHRTLTSYPLIALLTTYYQTTCNDKQVSFNSLNKYSHLSPFSSDT